MPFRMQSALAVAAVALAVPAHAPGRAPRIVDIVASDYAFDAPTRLDAGWVTIRMRNAGSTLHHVQLAKLPPGKRAADLVATVMRRERFPTWATDAGGPSSVGPGLVSNATFYLEPGHYAITCWADMPDGVPHLAKGMVLDLVVTAPARRGRPAASARAGDAPRHDVSVQLGEYAYTLSGPVVAGRRTVRVDNRRATQSHEVQLVALDSGKTLRDLVEWLPHLRNPAPAPRPPAPGRAIGGVTAIAKGTIAYFTADFTPGRYALLCFVPDEKDGKSHLAKGMMKEIVVE